MPDEVIVPDEKEEQPDPEPKDTGYDYAADHARTPDSIVRTPVVEPKKEEPKEEAIPDRAELDKTNPLEAAKQYITEQRQKDAEIARTEAEKHAKETVDRELKRRDDERTQAQKDAEEDKPIWEREGREPKDWQEVAAENRRINRREVLRDLKAEEAQTRAAAEKTKAEQTASQSTQIEAIQNNIGREMEELYTGGYLPRPVKVGDPEDAGEKMKTKLFELGVKINEERKAAGLPPEPSIAKIFFMNSDKLKEVAPTAPAGGDAPIAGARPAQMKQETQGYVYAKDHRVNETLEQYARRIQKQAQKA